MADIALLLLQNNILKHFNLCNKLAQSCLKNDQENILTNQLSLVYLYKEDLAFNNLEWLFTP